MRIGSLFSGAGGLDMAVQQVFGGRVVWHCENDPAASKVLAHHWPMAHNHRDITAVDWDTAEPIDVLCGGFPCQDVSAAGRRAGIRDGTRSGLWSQFVRAIERLESPIVIIENVRGLLNATAHRPVESQSDALGDGDSQPVLRAIGAVLGDLADLGYDAVWATVSAASVGAPHRRERVFIVATAADAGHNGRRRGAERDLEQATELAASRRHDAHGRHVGTSRGDGSQTVELLPTPKASQRASRKAMTQQHWSAPGLEQALEIARGELPREFESWDEVPGGSRPDLLPTPTSRDHKGQNQRGDDSCLTGALLPTPGASDGSGGRTPSESGGVRPSGSKRSVPLTDVPILLPTPAAADGQRGQDFARANHDGSGGDDLVTLAVKATNANQWGKYAEAIGRWEQIAGPAPLPTEPNSRGNPRLAPAFSEWMLGWPAGHVTAVPGISRNDQLRIIGNGVVPQQAEAALRYLLSVAEVAA